MAKGAGKLNPNDPVLKRASVLGKELSAILIESLAAENMQIDLVNAMPDKWGEEKKGRMMGAMAYRSASWKRAISWFTRGNEALGKEKPRGIANPDEVRATLGIISAGLVEKVIFDPTTEVGKFFCDHSIKHAAPAALRKRVGEMVTRIGPEGKVCGADFGSWDSRLLGPVKKAIENVISCEFTDALKLPPAIAEEVKAACNEESLRARGRYKNISAEDYGRLSGDRGTSVFNYITNYVLLIIAIERIMDKGYIYIYIYIYYLCFLLQFLQK